MQDERFRVRQTDEVQGVGELHLRLRLPVVPRVADHLHGLLVRSPDVEGRAPDADPAPLFHGEQSRVYALAQVVEHGLWNAALLVPPKFRGRERREEMLVQLEYVRSAEKAEHDVLRVQSMLAGRDVHGPVGSDPVLAGEHGSAFFHFGQLVARTESVAASGIART